MIALYGIEKAFKIAKDGAEYRDSLQTGEWFDSPHEAQAAKLALIAATAIEAAKPKKVKSDANDTSRNAPTITS